MVGYLMIIAGFGFVLAALANVADSIARASEKRHERRILEHQLRALGEMDRY